MKHGSKLPPRKRKTPARNYDAFTLILAVVLALIILGAIGYGIVIAPQVTAAIPLPATHY